MRRKKLEIVPKISGREEGLGMAGVRQDAERTILTTVRSQAEMKTLGAVSAPGRNERRKKKKMVGWVERVGVWKEFLEPRRRRR